eukprot:346947-Chlamydomonas_euryale.AAC.3
MCHIKAEHGSAGQLGMWAGPVCGRGKSVEGETVEQATPERRLMVVGPTRLQDKLEPGCRKVRKGRVWSR